MKKNEIQKILNSIDYDIRSQTIRIQAEIEKFMTQKSNAERQLRIIHDELEKLEATSSYSFTEKLIQTRDAALTSGDFTELDALLDSKSTAGLRIPTLRAKATYYHDLIGRLDREIGRLEKEISEIRAIAKWRIFGTLLEDFLSKNKAALSDLLSCDVKSQMSEFAILLKVKDITANDSIDNALDEIIADSKKEASE